MDARDPLIFLEGVCHQLGIIKYHPTIGADPPVTQSSSNAHVPVIRVKLTHSVRIRPMKSTVAPVQLVGERPAHGLALYSNNSVEMTSHCLRVPLQARMLQHDDRKSHRLQ